MARNNREKSRPEEKSRPAARTLAAREADQILASDKHEELEIEDTKEAEAEEIDLNEFESGRVASEEEIESSATELSKVDWELETAAEEPLTSGVSTSREITRFDPLQSYLAEIRHIPSLSREEEHQLALCYVEKGDMRAGYKLVLANLKLVVMVAREYQRNFQNILDLVQEGNIGLLEAIKQFDPYKGIRFPSYAVYWIRAYMLRYLINNLRLVKIGTTQAQRKLFFNLQKEKEKLEAEGFAPEAKLLASRLNVKESEVVEMQQRLALPDLSVDAPLSQTEDGPDFHSILPALGESVEERVVDEDFRNALRNSVEQFKQNADEKERALIEDRLLTDDPKTLQEVADQFGLSRERIRQIEARLKERLKEFLQERLSLETSGEVKDDPDLKSS